MHDDIKVYFICLRVCLSARPSSVQTGANSFTHLPIGQPLGWAVPPGMLRSQAGEAQGLRNMLPPPPEEGKGLGLSGWGGEVFPAVGPTEATPRDGNGGGGWSQGLRREAEASWGAGCKF